MTYDLSTMVKQRIAEGNTRRRVRPVSTRPGTKMQEFQLYRVYAKVIEYWQEVLKRDWLTTDALPAPEEVEESDPLMTVIEAEIARALLEWIFRSGEWVQLTWIRRVKVELGIDLRFMATNQFQNPKVQEAARWATSLIHDLNETTRRGIATALRDGIALGLSQEEIGSSIKSALKVSLRRAEVIAHDQTQKIVAKLNEEQQLEAGISEYVWQHSFLPNARRHHLERQGNRYRWDKPPRDGHPGYAINCRCTAAAVVGE